MQGQILEPVTLGDIETARLRLKQIMPPSPLISMEALNLFLGEKVYLKAECLLPSGSFKLRGAYNKIAALLNNSKHVEIITASAGNHAMGVSLAARWLNQKATVVVPATAPEVKKQTCRSLGAEVISFGEVYDDAYAHARSIEKETGKIYVHPVADTYVVAGQGTIGLEIIEQLPGVEQIVVPLGGGGLIYGIAAAVKSIKPSVEVIAVQPEGSPAYYRSMKENRLVQLDSVHTIADGLACKKPEPYLLDNIINLIDDVVLVKEKNIKEAIKTYLLYGKLLVEGAGATALAAFMEGLIKTNKQTVFIASGSNIDPNVLQGILSA